MPELIRLTVNGARHDVPAEPARSLLVVLREDLGLTGAKYGCAAGACGACTVLVDGAPVRACVTPAADITGRAVTTVEGLAPGGQLHPVQAALVAEGAPQCGYCMPGMVMAAAALLSADPDPAAARVVAALEPNICRCCAYPRILRAVHQAARLGPQATAASPAAAAATSPAAPAAAAGEGDGTQLTERLPHAAPAGHADDSAGSSPGANAEDYLGPRPQADAGVSGESPTPADAGGSGGSTPRAGTGMPWDLLPPGERGYFDALGDGLVSVLPPEAGPAGRPGPWRADGGAWLHVGADGVVTAFTGKVDVGQDNRTALSMLVAEELGVPLAAVRMVMGDTDICPYDVGTYGSRSMPDAGQALQAAAAAARQSLLDLAATALEVDPGRLSASGAAVKDQTSGAEVSYGDLVSGLRRTVTATQDAPVTDRGAWRTAGQPTRRPDAADAVTGVKRFTSDLTLPGMRHGRVLRPPAYGAVLRRADLRRARAVPGVTAVHEGSFVGIAAPDPVTAAHALALVDAEWDRAPQPAQRDLTGHLRAHPLDTQGWGGQFRHETGDVTAALEAADVQLAATYTTAYIAHVPLEPRVALARWRDGRVTVWTGTQRPFGVRQELAELLGVTESDVRVVVPGTGSGFGGKHAGPVAAEAARLARAAGAPVKVQWTREEEFTWGYFRPAAVIDVRSGASADGELTAWEFANLNSGAAAILSPYLVPSERIDFQPAQSPLPQGSYRALAATANNFARESHLDEVADMLDVDPVELRLRHLRDDRLALVLRAVAERAGWSWPGRPGSGSWRSGSEGSGSGRSGSAGFGSAGSGSGGSWSGGSWSGGSGSVGSDRADGHSLGIACGMEKDGRVATCAEVSVTTGGELEIHRIVTTYECGAVVNPDNVVNQIEGATIMALGGALFEAVEFGNGVILNASLAQYRVPRFTDVPPIDVVLMDRRDIPPAGAGETPMIAVAPALANAIFAATGQRIRTLPLLPAGTLPG